MNQQTTKKASKWMLELETGTILPFALSLESTGKMLSISRPGVYKLLERDPTFAACSFRIGERTLISSELLRVWVLKQCPGSDGF